VSLDGHPVLLHRLEQRRLGLRWGAVDLVREQQTSEDGPRPEDELAGTLVVDVAARKVAGQQVGRELSARVHKAQGSRQAVRGDGLPQTRQVLDEHVTSRQHACQDETQRIALADDSPLDLIEDCGGEAGRLGERERRFSHSRLISSR